jgi:hypothetical protein
MAEHEELTDADWRTLCDTLRGLDAMFDMLLVECADSSETARVVEAARRRRESVLENVARVMIPDFLFSPSPFSGD